MPAGTWYPDPTHHHQSRYVEGDRWTEFVADNGAVSRDPLPSDVGGQPPRHRRRKWPWIVGVVVMLVVGVVGIAGLDLAMNQLDRYTADLTKGHGSFPVVDNGVSAGSYESDGYHLLIRQADTWGGSYLEAPTAHTVLGVEIDTRAVQLPAGAAFGPFCWQDGTHGYGFVIDATGTRTLIQKAGSAADATTVLARVPGAPIPRGQTARLLLTCSIGSSFGAGPVTVKGYVNGTKAIQADGKMSLSEFKYTGFAGRSGTSASGEWAVTTFRRRGVHDIPNN